jgi:hypothetical protein
MKFFLSLITDKEWDGDGAKFFGLALIIAGLVGFFLGKSGFEWVIGFGAGMIGTGKWSEEKNGSLNP